MCPKLQNRRLLRYGNLKTTFLKTALVDNIADMSSIVSNKSLAPVKFTLSSFVDDVRLINSQDCASTLNNDKGK